MTDRRALIREYKDTPRTMGIGVVRNTISGKLLLLSGVDIQALLNRHRAQLRLSSHRNRALQEDWRAFGEAAFAFEVLDTLKPKDEPGYDPAADLAALADLWREKLGSSVPAYYSP